MDRRPTTTRELAAVRGEAGAPSGATSPADVGAGRHAPGRAAFAGWLRDQREQRGIALDEIARVTKIPLRTLTLLEQGAFERLPADVFVRGFLRNYARVVGLDGDDTLRRYDGAGPAAGPAVGPAAARAQAMLGAVAPLAPVAAQRATRPATTAAGAGAPEAASARLAVPVPPATMTPNAAVTAAVTEAMTAAGLVAVPTAPNDGPNAGPDDAPGGAAGLVLLDGDLGGELAAGSLRFPASAPPEPDPADPEPCGDDDGTTATSGHDPSARPGASRVGTGKRGRRRRRKQRAKSPSRPVAAPPVPPQDLAPAVASPQLAETAPGDAHAEPVTASTLAAPDTVDAEPAARSSIRVTPPRPVASVPVLVIDDAAPELAEAEQAERAAKQERRSFLPASLLDDRGSRQGGLTLAVIILLIVATLTLSYLMRRPSASGEGVTQAPAATPLPPG